MYSKKEIQKINKLIRIYKIKMNKTINKKLMKHMKINKKFMRKKMKDI